MKVRTVYDHQRCKTNITEISFDSEDFLDIVRENLSKLPQTNYELLKATIDLLQLIARNSETTKMSPKVSWLSEHEITHLILKEPGHMYCP